MYRRTMHFRIEYQRVLWCLKRGKTVLVCGAKVCLNCYPEKTDQARGEDTFFRFTLTRPFSAERVKPRSSRYFLLLPVPWVRSSTRSSSSSMSVWSRNESITSQESPASCAIRRCFEKLMP